MERIGEGLLGICVRVDNAGLDQRCRGLGRLRQTRSTQQQCNSCNQCEEPHHTPIKLTVKKEHPNPCVAILRRGSSIPRNKLSLSRSQERRIPPPTHPSLRKQLNRTNITITAQTGPLFLTLVRQERNNLSAALFPSTQCIHHDLKESSWPPQPRQH